MAERVAGRAEVDEWCCLLEETRQALAGLRGEDLEGLAERAENMAAAAGGRARTAEGGAGREQKAGMIREHRLLRDLLRATDRNLAVLRRLRGGAQGGEGSSRWVR